VFGASPTFAQPLAGDVRLADYVLCAEAPDPRSLDSLCERV
jgi:hypothetical protein